MGFGVDFQRRSEIVMPIWRNLGEAEAEAEWE